MQVNKGILIKVFKKQEKGFKVPQVKSGVGGGGVSFLQDGHP